MKLEKHARARIVASAAAMAALLAGGIVPSALAATTAQGGAAATASRQTGKFDPKTAIKLNGKALQVFFWGDNGGMGNDPYYPYDYDVDCELNDRNEPAITSVVIEGKTVRLNYQPAYYDNNEQVHRLAGLTGKFSNGSKYRLYIDAFARNPTEAQKASAFDVTKAITVNGKHANAGGAGSGSASSNYVDLSAGVGLNGDTPEASTAVIEGKTVQLKYAETLVDTLDGVTNRRRDAFVYGTFSNGQKYRLVVTASTQNLKAEQYDAFNPETDVVFNGLPLKPNKSSIYHFVWNDCFYDASTGMNDRNEPYVTSITIKGKTQKLDYHSYPNDYSIGEDGVPRFHRYAYATAHFKAPYYFMSTVNNKSNYVYVTVTASRVAKLSEIRDYEKPDVTLNGKAVQPTGTNDGGIQYSATVGMDGSDNPAAATLTVDGKEQPVKWSLPDDSYNRAGTVTRTATVTGIGANGLKYQVNLTASRPRNASPQQADAPKAVEQNGTMAPKSRTDTKLASVGYTDKDGEYHPVSGTTVRVPAGGAFSYEPKAGQQVTAIPSKNADGTVTWRLLVTASNWRTTRATTATASYEG